MSSARKAGEEQGGADDKRRPCAGFLRRGEAECDKHGEAGGDRGGIRPRRAPQGERRAIGEAIVGMGDEAAESERGGAGAAKRQQDAILNFRPRHNRLRVAR